MKTTWPIHHFWIAPKKSNRLYRPFHWTSSRRNETVIFRSFQSFLTITVCHPWIDGVTACINAGSYLKFYFSLISFFSEGLVCLILANILVIRYLKLSREPLDVLSVRGMEQFFRDFAGRFLRMIRLLFHFREPATRFIMCPKQFRLIMLSVGTIWNRKHKGEIIVRSIKSGGKENPAWTHPAEQTRFKIGSAKKEIFQIQ